MNWDKYLGIYTWCLNDDYSINSHYNVGYHGGNNTKGVIYPLFGGLYGFTGRIGCVGIQFWDFSHVYEYLTENVGKLRGNNKNIAQFCFGGACWYSSGFDDIHDGIFCFDIRINDHIVFSVGYHGGNNTVVGDFEYSGWSYWNQQDWRNGVWGIFEMEVHAIFSRYTDNVGYSEGK